MFDVRVPTVEEGGPPEGLSIIAVEMSTFLEDEICVEVYSKRGTYQGFENDVYEDADGSWSSDTWSILGAAMVEGQGEGLPTSLPIGSLDKVYLQPGSTQALYVTLTVPEMRYTEPKYNEQSGDLFSTSDDGHLELMVGSAVAYPFEEVWANRIFNGAVIYALGDVEDGKYSDVMEGDRLRACPAPPTESPVASPPVDVNATTASTAAATATDAAAVVSPTEGGSGEAGIIPDVVDTVVSGPTPYPTFGTTDLQAGNPRLYDYCATDLYGSASSKEVVVPYEYTMITDGSQDVYVVAEEMENVLHRSLLADKCPAGTESRVLQEMKVRMLQDIAYEGFNSNPFDEPSSEGCGADVTVGDGQVCHVITGGVTAVVASDADEEAVQSDIGAYVEEVLSEPANYEELGVQSVSYGTEGLEVDGAEEGTQDPESSDDGGLSTTGIIVIAVVAGILLLVILAMVAMRLRKKRRTKRADKSELFQEFEEEDEGPYGGGMYGVTASSSQGYRESFVPPGSGSMYPPPPPRPSSRASSRSSARASPAAIILNEADDMSFESKSRFAPSSLRVAPDSPGSKGSGGSGSSKKSVEFQMVDGAINVMSQPEDTVDL